MEKIKVVRMRESAWGFAQGQYVLDLGVYEGNVHYIAGIPEGWGRMSVLKVNSQYFEEVIETTRSHIIGRYLSKNLK